MTVKSPFHNKPSTATSVDALHKCPLVPVQAQDSSVPKNLDDVNVQKDQPPAGFESSQVSASSSNDTNRVVEPCSSSAATSDSGLVPVTSCSNCGTTTTPLWRRSPQGETICNACGLYLKARNTTRPPWLKRSNKCPAPPSLVALAPAPPKLRTVSPVSTPVPSPPAEDSCDEHQHQQCANCQTTTTPLWRRDEQGNTICNACGLYYKLHNVHRPITMKRSIIKRRKRVAAVCHGPSNTVHQHYPPGQKRRLSFDEPAPKRAAEGFRPLLPLRPPTLDPVEPDAFPRQHSLPSPPMKPSKIASLLNPMVEKDKRSLPSLPSPPLSAYDSMPMSTRTNSGDPSVNVTAATAAAFATVSALLNPTPKTHQTLEAHRHELQREVSNLTSLLTKTTTMLQNLDQVMAVTGKNNNSNTDIASSLLALAGQRLAAVYVNKD
ncbi:putative electron transfer flavoprotein subunit [Apophysomyces sp. BC1034]|nr:putative electron transfer flavoprotein subunit [Apophysomyces sp. BC1015]KAG0181265.1 putative electron transfer flavoprotein subunit [Apophysomyces sp. BC1021]KAG0193120.1 putative electron transfer flavoprotein subunit [Apophysomyces sp. BC1034]